MKIVQATRADMQPVTTFYEAVVRYQIVSHQLQWEYDEVTWDALMDLYALEDLYLMKDQEVIVAACFIVNEDLRYWPKLPKNNSLFIHKLAVHPNYRKQHLGDQMLSFFKQQGKQQKMKDVRLDVREYKHKLRMFYERNGFQLVEIASVWKSNDTALYCYRWEELDA